MINMVIMLIITVIILKILGEVRQALAALGAGSRSTVCTFFPRALGVRKAPTEAMPGTYQVVGKQKEWSQSGQEVSCLPANLWRDPDSGVAFGGGPWPSALMERYVTRALTPSPSGTSGASRVQPELRS